MIPRKLTEKFLTVLAMFEIDLGFGERLKVYL